MKYECEVIEDLLPLYLDDICGNATKKAVDEHLNECPKCRDLLSKMKDPVIDEEMLREKNEVILYQSRFFKRKSAVAGSIIAGIFAIPILICLIVNLATGSGLSWFFLVLAAMFIPTSLFVVPLIAPKNKMFMTMCSLTLSVILLIAVVCIYSGGSWFFTAASAVLFGFTLIFSPFIACRRPMKDYLGNKKGLAVMSADTLTFFLMLGLVDFPNASAMYLKEAFIIGIPMAAMIWAIFLIIRYLPVNALAKTGICITAITLLGRLASLVIEHFMLNLSDPTAVMVYNEPAISYVIIAAATGAALALLGIITGERKGGKNQ